MGEAKNRLRRRDLIIAAHPWCIYCGAQATTTDHCPPRAAFRGRNWPDTYEFPCCAPCNSSARIDELVLAALFRGDFESGDRVHREEWERLVQGVRNNAPHIAAEWHTPSRNEVKRILRLAYGSEGDERRRQGWSAITMGPLTLEIVQRFMTKLSKALYFKLNGHVLDGVAYTHRIDRLRPENNPEYLAEILRMAPGLPELSRNSKSLYDQFIYRFNHSPEHRVMYAVVQFSVQWMFQLIAVGPEMDAQLIAGGDGSPTPFRHECFLDPNSDIMLSMKTQRQWPRPLLE
jgi:hypothetical protein